MATILAVEDEHDILDNLIDLLESEGHRVVAAADGREGVSLARETHPDLILCDVMMPNLDGHGMLSVIQADDELRDTPFIFLTAMAEREDLRRGMNAGADDYLTKPFTADELISAVDSRLARAARIRARAEVKLEALRTQLAAMIPHELRTPLAIVLGYTSLLREAGGDLTPTETEEMLGSVYDASEQLRQLVSRYELWAGLRLAASNAPESAAPAFTSEATRLIADVARAAAERHGRAADLWLDLAEAEAAIATDHLDRVVTELVDNAFKFSAPGTPVEVCCQRIGEQFVLAVFDRGRGLSLDQLRRLGAFTQFDRDLYEQPGSGLGLALVLSMAQLCGGTLKIERLPGGRTMAQVLLPGADATRGDWAVA